MYKFICRVFTVSLLLLSGTLLRAYAVPPGNESALGPLGGRNIYLLHLPWFSFPADRAASLPHQTRVIRTAFYYVNDFATSSLDNARLEELGSNKLTTEQQNEFTALDYESFVLEIGMDWQFNPGFRMSLDWRLHFLHGGFLDSIIEGFHSFLGVANAGRQYFDVNRVQWNIESVAGFNYAGSGAAVVSGDTDLRSVWTLIQRQNFALALGAAFKIPTGLRSKGFGSNNPDIAFEILADWRPWKRWAFYGNAGVIFPFDGMAKVMVQFIPAIEFRVSRGISLVLQMNLQTSAIYSPDKYLHEPYGVVHQFSLIQTDLKVGIKGRHGRFEWQFYVEEDPITWEGPDIVFNLGFGYRF